MSKPFLYSYGGQTTAELIALKDDYRIDSLVLAFEQAIDLKPEADLSNPELVVLAIEAMEREVNNGGWDQFFLNTENRFNSVLVTALETIGCPGTAAISRDAILANERGSELDEFDGYDALYYANSESIADKLFEYIVNSEREIQLPSK